MWNWIDEIKLKDCSKQPASFSRDLQSAMMLPSPFNWRLKKRGPDYLQYLEKSYGMGSDKKYPIENVAMLLIIAYEQPSNERGFRKGLEYIDKSIEIINNQQMSNVLQNVCKVSIHATKCIINLMLKSYADAREDLEQAEVNVAALSHSNEMAQLNGLKALVLFEQRTQIYIEETKILLESLRDCSSEQWFWSYMLLRVIRHERELSSPRNYIEYKEVLLLRFLFTDASNVNDLLRLVILYRRSKDFLDSMHSHNKKFSITKRLQIRIQFFNMLFKSFRKWQLIALNELSDDALPIPDTKSDMTHVIDILRERTGPFEIDANSHIATYLRGLVFETIDASSALRSYLKCGMIDLNFDCDLNAAILKVKLGQAEDPIDDFQNMLLRYERRDLKMLLLVNIGYHLFYDREEFEAGVHYWNQALEVDINSPLLKLQWTSSGDRVQSILTAQLSVVDWSTTREDLTSTNQSGASTSEATASQSDRSLPTMDQPCPSLTTRQAFLSNNPISEGSSRWDYKRSSRDDKCCKR